MKQYSHIKKAAAVILCLAIFLTLCACGPAKKTAINTETFLKKAEENGLLTEESDVTADHIVKGTLAGKAESSSALWVVEFYEINSEENAKGMYAANLEDFESVSGTSKSISKGNYSTYEKTGGGQFMYICRVDKTLLFAKVKEEYKDEVKAFIEKLGY